MSGRENNAGSTDLQRSQAIRIVSALRQGSNCLEWVDRFSAGREVLFRAAMEEMEELELSNGTSVRWLKGRYGNGKTHIFARLMDAAHSRNWVTTYVQISGKGSGTELSKFNDVYSAMVQNCLCSGMVEEDSGKIDPGNRPGLQWILDDWTKALIKKCGARGGEIPTFKLQEEVSTTINVLRTKWGLSGDFAMSMQEYVLARSSEDAEWASVILDWFHGENVHGRGGAIRKKLYSAGIRESLKKKNAKGMLRGLSAFIRYRGFGGILVLLDEVENVLGYTPRARREAYTVMRELIDNVDDRHGMTSTCFYAAGTPDLFESETGITEYEALASRVLLSSVATVKSPRAALLDLSWYPLTKKDFIEIADKVTDIYEIKAQGAVSNSVRSAFPERADEMLGQNADLSVREWVRTVVAILEST